MLPIESTWVVSITPFVHFSRGVLSGGAFSAWHFVPWRFVLVAFYPVALFPLGVLLGGVLSEWRFVPGRFIIVAFCPVAFFSSGVLSRIRPPYTYKSEGPRFADELFFFLSPLSRPRFEMEQDTALCPLQIRYSSAHAPLRTVQR